MTTDLLEQAQQDQTENSILVIPPDKAPEVFKGEGLGVFFDFIKSSVNEIADTTTAKGRTRIASLAAKVSRSKTLVDKAGRDYLKQIKEMPKLIETELREFANDCDALRDSVRKPLTDWEDKQANIKAEAEAKKTAEELALRIESDQEIAILMNRDFDRQRAEEKTAAETAQRERDELIAKQAAEAATKAAEEKAAAEIEAARLATERAKIEQAKAEQCAKDAEAREQEHIKNHEESVKRQIAAEKLEAERAQKMRDEDELHRRQCNSTMAKSLIGLGLSQEQAKTVIIAVLKGQIEFMSIKY